MATQIQAEEHRKSKRNNFLGDQKSVEKMARKTRLESSAKWPEALEKHGQENLDNLGSLHKLTLKTWKRLLTVARQKVDRKTSLASWSPQPLRNEGAMKAPATDPLRRMWLRKKKEEKQKKRAEHAATTPNKSESWRDLAEKTLGQQAGKDLVETGEKTGWVWMARIGILHFSGLPV